MPRNWKKALAACALLLATAVAADAATLRLTLVDTFRVNSPFGLAFDGTNLHWSNFSDGRITEITTAGVNTGRSTASPHGPSALAWNGTQLLASNGRTITFFDRVTSGNRRAITVDTRIPNQIALIDGLDFKQGEIWWSPDVGRIHRLNATTGQLTGPNAGAPNFDIPVPPRGGFSGVERVDTNCPDIGNIILVVNDAFNPRRLTAASLDGSRVIAETTIPNSRYEDLTFDGAFLYAADLFGNKIDKIRVTIDDCDIAGVPEPGTLTIAGVTVLGLLGYRLRRRQQA